MRHAVLDAWSRQDSRLHRLDPRLKVFVLLVFLVAVSTSRGLGWSLASLAALPALAAVTACLPVLRVLARGVVVLPFALSIGVLSVLAGETGRALLLAAKCYTAAVAVVVLVGATPLPRLMHGMESLGVPRFLLLVIHVLYRYLFVVAEEAGSMLTAADSRGGRPRGKLAFRSGAGLLAVLFARSFQRAEAVHRAMSARGFAGRFPVNTLDRPSPVDYLLACVASLSIVFLRVVLS